jgi:hypothetical protein
MVRNITRLENKSRTSLRDPQRKDVSPVGAARARLPQKAALGGLICGLI